MGKPAQGVRSDDRRTGMNQRFRLHQIKLGDIKIEGKTISFIIDDPGAPGNPTFKGALDAAGVKIAGEFSQSGLTGTFSVDKEK